MNFCANHNIWFNGYCPHCFPGGLYSSSPSITGVGTGISNESPIKEESEDLKFIQLLQSEIQRKDEMIEALNFQINALKDADDAIFTIKNAEIQSLKAENERLNVVLKKFDLVLGSLIYLKNLKDTNGKTPEYLEGQPKAWINAKELHFEFHHGQSLKQQTQ